MNRDIQRRAVESARWHRTHPERIDERLRQLDREWDIERALEANAAALALAGAALTIVAGRRWAALPLVVSGFLLQHALQGWRPPLPVFRRLGFRTEREIEDERRALEAVQADSFRGLT